MQRQRGELVLLRGREKMERTDWEEAWRTWKGCWKDCGRSGASLGTSSACKGLGMAVHGASAILGY